MSSFAGRTGRVPFAPSRHVFPPRDERLGLRRSQVFPLLSLCNQRRVIAEGLQRAARRLEIPGSEVKAVGENGHHALDLQPFVTQSLHRGQAGLARADEVLDHDHIAGIAEVAFDAVALAMPLGLAPHVAERKAQLVGDVGSPRDAARGNTGNHVGLAMDLLDDGAELLPDVGPNRGVAQCHAVVTVNRGAQSGRPREGGFRCQLDRLDAKQRFCYFPAFIQG